MPLAAATLVIGILVAASPARAQDAASALPFDGAVSLGSPASRVEVRIETDQGDTVIRVSTGRHTAEARLPGERTSGAIRAVGTTAAEIRAEGGAGPASALVVVRRGRPEIAWQGRLSMRGDPGEQIADAIEIADRTGDGREDVVVGQLRQGVGLCGGAPALLFPRALDPRTLALRPVVLRRVPATGDEIAITAATAPPSPVDAPLVRSLTAAGASSQGFGGEDAAMLEAPRALSDGDPATAWTEGRGGNGDQELAVLRWGGPPIHAIALVAPPSGRAPSTIVIVPESGPRLRVTLPALAAGARAWVVPPAPIAAACFSIVLADPAGEAASHTGLAEVEVYTEIDFGGGIDALVADLVRDGEGGDRTTELLARLGERGVVALAAAWDRLGARGRERAARVASGPARGGSEPALALLERAAADEHEEVRTSALEALARSGGPGRARIVAVAAGTGAPAEAAAQRLAEADAQFDVAPLLAAASAEGGSERPRLRAAIARGLAIGRSEDVTAVERWEDAAPVAARAAVALGLAADPATRGLALRIAHRAREGASGFVDRFRLASAIATIDGGDGQDPALSQHERERAAIDAWLARIAAEAEEWMLREIALRALGARDRAAARDALDDGYPRVRVAAVDALARSDQDLARLRAVLAGDRWPLVRVAALDGLADREAERAAVRAALDDDAQMVRRRAIEHLTRLRDRGAAEAISARLRDEAEWPIVTDASLLYVEELCVREAGESVLAVIRRGIRPGAWEPHVEEAVRALRLAQRLGPEVGAEARAIAARGDERMQAALAVAPPEPCTAP